MRRSGPGAALTAAWVLLWLAACGDAQLTRTDSGMFLAPDAEVLPDAMPGDVCHPDAPAADAPAPDAFAPDALAPDASAPDALAPDALAPDAPARDAEPFPDADPPEIGPPDLGFPDADPEDLGEPDAGEPDLGEPDLGEPDLGEPDLGEPDLGEPDLGEPDSGEADAGELDAGEPDADEPDAGDPIDAAAPDAIPRDLGPLGIGVATLAGWDEPGSSDGPRGLGQFNNPVNLIVGPSGEVYVSDFYNDRIARLEPDGFLTVFYSGGLFRRPFGLTFTSTRTLLVETDRNAAGFLGGAIWRIDMSTRTATVIADNVGRPRGLAVLPDGRIVLSDDQRDDLRILDVATGTITVLAGMTGVPGFADGVGAMALFDDPSDIILTSSTTLLVADSNNHRLREVTLGGAVSTFAGVGTSTTIDGPRLLAGFAFPRTLAQDAAGRIYVGGSGYQVRQIDPAGNVTTVAGDGVAGFADAEDPLLARFFGMEGLDVTPDGMFIYVADGSGGLDLPYHRVRRIQRAP